MAMRLSGGSRIPSRAEVWGCLVACLVLVGVCAMVEWL